MDADKRLKLEEEVVKMLKTVYDPEIPMADFIIEDTRIKLESIEGLKSVTINLVFEPEWNKDMMSEEAKLELGFL